ncbi:MAG: SHOCT domain-containing protein [Pseudomonadota bacterium]|nr:SHOCT domain-containing protein [Pseudomonadota bacterium]
MNAFRAAAAAVAMATVTIPAQATADEPYALTPSGATEAFFDMPITEASDRLVNGCIDAGQTVISSTPTVVVCEFYLNTLESVLSQLLIGNSYSTPPRSYVRFNLAGLDRTTRVTANAWIETQMAFGQTRREDMQSANYHNDVMSFFALMGGRFPPGTEYPNHAFIGASFETVEEPEKGIRIRHIEPGQAAERAGLRVGDVITRLAKERTKGPNDLLDGLHKAIKNPTFVVEFYRGSEKMKVDVEREFRMTEREPVDLPSFDEPEQAVAAMAPIAPISLADELAKFAALRDQGVITDEEFEAQKAKLLAQ